MRLYQAQLLWVTVDLGVMIKKGYTTFPKDTRASPSDDLVSYPGHSLSGGLTPLQRSSWLGCVWFQSTTKQKFCGWYKQINSVHESKILSLSDGVVEYSTSLQRGKIPRNECPAYDTKKSDGEVPVILELWEYPFIAIAPRSTVTLSGSTW